MLKSHVYHRNIDNFLRLINFKSYINTSFVRPGLKLIIFYLTVRGKLFIYLQMTYSQTPAIIREDT